MSEEPQEVPVAVAEEPPAEQEAQPKIFCFSGSRTWDRPNTIINLVHSMRRSGNVKEIAVGFNPQRRTPRGVDLITYDACVAVGMPVKTFIPRWMVNGHVNKGAGFIRNIEMIEYADYLVSFWDKSSRGSAHAIVEAYKRNKLYRIITYSEEMEDQEALLQRAAWILQNRKLELV